MLCNAQVKVMRVKHNFFLLFLYDGIGSLGIVRSVIFRILRLRFFFLLSKLKLYGLWLAHKLTVYTEILVFVFLMRYEEMNMMYYDVCITLTYNDYLFMPHFVF